MRSDPDGFHIWLRLPERTHAEAFEYTARHAGVLLRSAATFAVDARTAPDAVRLCLSHEADRGRVRDGLERLALLLDKAPDPSAFVV